ncbi:lipocalin family protein [Flavobacterium piscisymbiosum]|uniref:Lipocalin family protein n=1 Tax=Flavobacterium piscisymbiosum TaxID=2893753 RepID=A0ABS8MIP8_9FLAO|nr:lipocalin family protein [Flavobacterium sp. F-30]MCC9064831.1 lipocalin family protein [Flavobacterium sp. F-30]
MLSLFLLILTSCSNSSEIIPDDTSGDIQGVWQLKALYVSGMRQPLSECRLNESLAFEQNSIIVVQTDETSNTSCDISTVEGTFSRSDNTLSITFPKENRKVKIKELTKAKLVIISENNAEMMQYEKAN